MNYYNILQIDENATQEEVRQAYHKMARLFHPDNFKGAQKDAEEQMAKINEAYDILYDVNKRAAYDLRRKTHEYEESDVENKDNMSKPQEEEYTNSMEEQSGVQKRKKSLFFNVLNQNIRRGNIFKHFIWNI